MLAGNTGEGSGRAAAQTARQQKQFGGGRAISEAAALAGARTEQSAGAARSQLEGRHFESVRRQPLIRVSVRCRVRVRAHAIPLKTMETDWRKNKQIARQPEFRKMRIIVALASSSRLFVFFYLFPRLSPPCPGSCSHPSVAFDDVSISGRFSDRWKGRPIVSRRKLNEATIEESSLLLRRSLSAMAENEM